MRARHGNLKPFLTCIVVIAIAIVLFILLEPFLPYHALHGDERYYIGRALQNIEFYLGMRSARAVWFSSGNHPFSAETIIGLSILLQGEFREAPKNPWKTPIDMNLLVAARRSALLTGLLGLGACMFLAIHLNPWLALVPLLYLLASPGFVDFSMRCMLDIYLASFVTLTLASIVLYIITKSRKCLLISGFFAGLALGSKTGWDPLIMFIVCSVAILAVERAFKSFIKRWILFTMTSFITFCLTSFVIVLRLVEHINSIFMHHTRRIELSHMFLDQPLVSGSIEEIAKGYNIFIYQHPICVLVTSMIVIMLSVFLAMSSFSQRSFLNTIIKKIERDSLLMSVILVTLFTALTLVLTSMTFEYGRNYARLTLYENLVLVLSLAYLLRLLKRTVIKTLLLLPIYIFLFIAFYSYHCNMFGTCYPEGPLFFKTNYALVPSWSWLKGEAPLAYLIPWSRTLSLIPLSGMLLLTSTLIFLTLALVLWAYLGATLVFQKMHSIANKIAVFKGVQQRLYDVSGKVNTKSKPASHYKPPEVSGQEVEKIPEYGTQKPREETESLLERVSLSNLAAMLLREVSSECTNETLIKAINKLIKTYEELRDLKGLTLREALLNIAQEYNLNVNEIFRLIHSVENYVYGNKPLAPEVREMVIRLLVKLKEQGK